MSGHHPYPMTQEASQYTGGDKRRRIDREAFWGQSRPQTQAAVFHLVLGEKNSRLCSLWDPLGTRVSG